MAYTPTVWKNRAVQHPRRIKLKDIVTGDVVATYDTEVDPGLITEEGVTVTDVRMNNIEDGISKANNDFTLVLAYGGLPYLD